jgi:class 3 adenylate cyclase
MLIADLIDELERRSVTAIGLNLRFDRPTEPVKDKLLYDRLRSVEVPLVVSMVSNKTGYSDKQRKYSINYLQGLHTGLSLMIRDTIDHTVRASLLRLEDKDQTQLGFAATLAQIVGIEVPQQKQIHIDYRQGPDIWTPPFPVFRAEEVASLPRSALEGRIVLIGTDLGHTQRLRTPFSVLSQGLARDLPGVMIEAHVLSQLVENRAMKISSARESLLITLLMAMIGCLLSLIRVNLLTKVLVPLALLPFAWLGAFMLYIIEGSIVPIVSPTIAFVTAIIVTSFWQWRTEMLRRERVHHVFGQFLAPTVVDQILQKPDELELGGEVREVSFLFTDLEGFTRLTETTQPRVMVGLVNNYLEDACNIVISHGGTIDKIVGDALHVMFNAPLLQQDHARRAVECGLALDTWSEEFRRRYQQQGIDLGVTRIGINTGNCIVGNFGGESRFDYTAHGDAINSAARLEAINKQLGTKICVSESTVSQCQGMYFRSVATLVLRGKNEAIRAYTPLTMNRVRDAKIILYERAYELLTADDPDSEALFDELARLYPQDPLISLHFNRIRQGTASTTLVIGQH